MTDAQHMLEYLVFLIGFWNIGKWCYRKWKYFFGKEGFDSD